MKHTKEQLLAINGELRGKVESLEKALTEKDERQERVDKSIRESLSISLGAGTQNEGYGDRKQLVYSWYSIFREVGKLLAKKEYVDLVEAIEHHTIQIGGLQERMEELDGPNSKHRQ